MTPKKAKDYDLLLRRGHRPEVASSNDPLILFPKGSTQGIFIKREKRFRVQVETQEGLVWAHCNNSGSMLNLLRPRNIVFMSPAYGPSRKLPFTLELIQSNGTWVGVNTLVPNRLLARAWEQGLIQEARGYDYFHSEVEIGGSRLDALLRGPKGRLWLEAKNVTLVEADVAYFPDAPTSRGQRHLRELLALVSEGERAACFFLVQREDARCFSPADFIDPLYAQLFWKAIEKGVEVWAYSARVSPRGISLGERLPVFRP